MSIVKILTSYFNRVFCTAILFLLFAQLNAQEICNNGIDDNGNGLIDLNDTVACNCAPQPPSLIPNASFEEKNCCPSTFSQMNCAKDWIQASSATADYMNACGFIFPAATAAGLAPFPDGNAIAGFISSIGYQEYIGACLITPMLANTTYSLQMQIASTAITGQGGVCNGGAINYSASDIVIYGSTNCSNMPFVGDSCPPAAQWQILASTLYTPVSAWGTISFTFTPSININAIIIGAPCTLPPSYTGSSTTCYPYFYVDNLELNKTEPDSSINKFTSINQTGSWCANTTVLSGDTISGATYQWYHNGVAIVGQTTNVLNLSANNLPTGLYSMAITLGSACKYNSINVVEYANPPSISQTSSYCKYDPAFTLTANIAGGIWSGSGITNANAGTFNPATANVGNNTIIYTLPNAGACARADTAFVVVEASPIANAGSDTTICSGASLTIGGPSTSGYFYSWAPTSGLSNAFISAPTFTLLNSSGAAITANYSLIVMDPLTGCQALDQLVVTVNPTATINPTGPFCRNDPGGILTASTTGGTWSGTGIINSNFGTFSPAAANIGNNLITYSVTGACGGGDTAIVVVTEPVPSNAGANVTVCAGDSVLIGTSSTVGYTYSWAPATALNSSTVSNPYVLATNSGTSPQVVSYILSTSYNGCTGKDTVVATINPQPNLEVMNPPAACASIPVDITAPSITTGTSGGGVLSYWLDSMATMPLTNPNTITTAGTYYIKATATGGCFDIKPVAVTLNVAPTANAGNDVLMCTGDTISIGAANVPGNTYTWSPTSGINNPAISNPSITLTNNGSTPQTLVYIVTTTAAGCSDLDTVTIVVNPLPVADAGLDMEVCAGINATLNGSVVGVSGGSWSGGSGTYSPSNNTLNAEYTPVIGELIQGSVTFILTTDVPSGGCNAVTDTVVLTFAVPAIANAGNDDTICGGGVAFLNGSFGGSATSGSWSGGDGVFTPNNNQLNATYTPSAAEIEAGNVTLVFTTDNPTSACLAETDTVFIEIQSSPLANAGANQFVCAGTEINLSGTISGSATSASWSGGQGVFYPSANTLSTTYIPSVNEQSLDSIVLKLTTNNPIGFPCAANMDSVIVYFYPKPIPAFNANNYAGCPELCVDFMDLTNLNGGSAINAWTWTFGDNSADESVQNPSHCYSQTGVYDVTLAITSQDNCKDTLTITQFIQVHNAPTASFDYTPNPATVTTTTITLNDVVSNDVSMWVWDFGDGDSLVSDSAGAVHVYPSNVPGTYQTTLIVQNAFGCVDTITNNVVIHPEFSFFIPNAFSPNGDGMNDFFGAKGLGIETYELFVFNRWGNLVFSTNDINKMWDGTLSENGETVAQDIYVWKVNITNVFQEKYNYIGTVTVVR